MNKYMMKSLRQAMLSTAAAALVSIGFTACSDETFVTQKSTVPADSYQVIIPASKGGAGTRAITYNSETGGYDATFEVTDRILVYNVTQKAEGRKVTDGITPLYPDAKGKTANLVGDLGFSRWDETGTLVVITPAVGDELLLLYNNRYWYWGFDFDYNNGTGENLPDYAIAKVTIESINEGVIKTTAASFENPQSAYRINFTGIGSGVKIKKVNIESKQNNLVSSYYPTDIEGPHYFSNVDYTYDGEGTDQHVLTFMLRFADNPNNDTSGSGDVISFRALGSDGHYYFGTKTVTNELVEGLYYLAEVPLTDVGLALTLTNSTTDQQVEVFDRNNIYTKDAGYTIKNTGYNNIFQWYGGSNTLTLKGVTMNSKMGCLSVYTHDSDPENTKEHYLLLDGENTLTGPEDYYSQAMTVYENSTLHISETSSGGELIVSPSMGIRNNAKVILESGVVTINGYLNENDNSSFIISKGGKLRIPNDAWIREGGIKAADGYVLMISQDGDYKVYSAIEDDGSGRAKSIWVTPTAVLGYRTNDHDGTTLDVVVMPENTTNKSVTWTTSNPNVVAIEENGYIYSRGIGEAIVTATTNDGSNLSAECKVTVKPFGGILYEQHEISMSPESPSFINPLTIEGKGVTSVAYASSDESIATVNASTGEVKIVAGATVGQTATITATATVTEDGDYVYPGWYRQASYTVKVASAAGQGEREDYEPDTW